MSAGRHGRIRFDENSQKLQFLNKSRSMNPLEFELCAEILAVKLPNFINKIILSTPI